MIEYMPSIVLFGTIIAVIMVLGTFIIGLYFMIKKLIIFNDSLKNKKKDDRDNRDNWEPCIMFLWLIVKWNWTNIRSP